MTKRPTFSLLTVTRNDLAGIRATADSVAAQTDDDFEWIVLDGASTDGTREWLEAGPPAPCDWVSERDRGTFDAMNKGLDRARGEYALFLNGGDSLAAPETLTRVHEALRSCEPHPDLVFGDSIDVQPDGREHYRPARPATWIGNGMFTSHQAMFFRLDHHPALRHDLAYPNSGDYAFAADFLRRPPGGGGSSTLHVPIAICRFALGGNHYQKRAIGMREDFLIRRRILGQSLARASLLWAAHSLHHAGKKSFPDLLRRLRYRDVPAAEPRPR